MEIILVFMIGSIFGSFFGLMIDRMYLEESLLFPSSHCNNCQHGLSPRDLIPIFSQIFSKSRCRYCGVKIPYRYALIEFLTGILFLLLWLNLFDFSIGIMLLMSLILSVFDIKYQEFPFFVWLAFALFISLTSDFQLYSLIFLVLAALASLRNIKMGSGDFLWLFLASLTLDLYLLPLLLLLASSSGILFILTKRRTEIAFIPHLSLAYLILIVLSQNQSL